MNQERVVNGNNSIQSFWHERYSRFNFISQDLNFFEAVTDQIMYLYPGYSSFILSSVIIVYTLEFVQMLQPPIPIPPEQMEAERKKLEEEMKKKEKILAQVRINILYANK